jgi:hypothetical protein
MVVSKLGGKAERLLFRLPIVLTVAFGLFFIAGRFIAALRSDFKEAPDNWASFMLLAVMIGSVSLMVVFACMAVGAVIGWILEACFAKRLSTALSRYSSKVARQTMDPSDTGV